MTAQPSAAGEHRPAASMEERARIFRSVGDFVNDNTPWGNLKGSDIDDVKADIRAMLAFAREIAHPPQSAEDDLTAVYMAGRYDGRREAPQSADPVAWVSPRQLAAMAADPTDAGGAAYLPLRHTSAGNLTMPLFAAPQSAASAVEAMREALQRIADPRNKNFAGDARVVAIAALVKVRDILGEL